MTAVIPANIRVLTWNNVSTFINSNKTSAWTVLSAFPEQNPVFPCIVVNPASIKMDSLSLSGCSKMYYAEVNVEFYSPAKNGKNYIDTEKDKIANAFLTGGTTLLSYNLILKSPEEIMNDDSDELVFNGSKLNYGVFTLSLEVRA